MALEKTARGVVGRFRPYVPGYWKSMALGCFAHGGVSRHCTRSKHLTAVNPTWRPGFLQLGNIGVHKSPNIPAFARTLFIQTEPTPNADVNPSLDLGNFEES